MRFFSAHLMPWDRLPADFNQRYGSAWTRIPNELYLPEHGQELYNRYLDELVLAEELGFDGVCVNEHHQTAYGTMPSPNLIAAILARQTKRIKIAVVGNALPLHSPPTRVAEEYAMIDCISGGRLIAGMVVGGGPEYHSSSLNPTHARSMFAEAMDLILRAWTEPGPFEHYGKHWKLRNVNPWPRPLQKPHPPIWIPGAGSQETIRFVAERHYSYMGIPYFHLDFFKHNFDTFREACEQNGYTADPEQLGWLVPIYVARTDAQAWEEYEEHFWYFAHKLLKGLTVFPPGYTSARSLPKINHALGRFMTTLKTCAEVEQGTYALVGSPQTVRDRLIDCLGTLDVGNLLGLFHLGTLPAHQTRQNLRLFAEEVMPAVRRAFTASPMAGPNWPRRAMPEDTKTSHTTVLDVRGRKTQIMQGGDGPPLLYLHSAASETDWLPFHEGLAAHFRVFAPAHPGFALSGGLEEIDDVADMAWHYVDLLDELGLERVRLVGFSLGAWIALELAVLRPARVEKLVLVASVGLRIEGAPIADIFLDDISQLRALSFGDPDDPAADLVLPSSNDDARILHHLRARSGRARWLEPVHAQSQARGAPSPCRMSHAPGVGARRQDCAAGPRRGVRRQDSSCQAGRPGGLRPHGPAGTARRICISGHCFFEAMNLVTSSAASALPAYEKGAIAAADGATKPYVRIGNGRLPLVIIPGAGDGFRTAADVAVYLAWFYRPRCQDFRLLVLSRREPIPPGFTAADHADDMIRTVNELDWGRSLWECLSAGGPIGQQAAVQGPDLVEGLVLTSSLHHTIGRTRAMLEQWLEMAQEPGGEGALYSIIEHKHRPPANVLSPAQLADTEALKARHYPHRLQNMLRPLLDLDHRQLLPCIGCPTLVISGQDDRFVPVPLQKEMAELIPHCRHVISEGYGHFHDLENPGYHDLVGEFAQSIR